MAWNLRDVLCRCWGWAGKRRAPARAIRFSEKRLASRLRPLAAIRMQSLEAALIQNFLAALAGACFPAGENRGEIGAAADTSER